MDVEIESTTYERERAKIFGPMKSHPTEVLSWATASKGSALLV